MSRRRRQFPTARKPVQSADSSQWIYGVHAASAALLNRERAIKRAFATINGQARIADALQARSADCIEVSSDELEKRLGRNTIHQGVLIEVAPLPPCSLQKIIAASALGRPMIVLDQVTDPQNVGAILRSAAAFDASGLLMTRRHSPPLDGATAKAASGAVEHVPIVLVANLARTLEELGKLGVLRIGLDGAATDSLETTTIDFPCALVLGAEDKGLRRLTAENCDRHCRLTTPGTQKSLNVSNAAAVALHDIVTR